MELSQLFALLRRWAWLLVLGLIIGVGAGYFISQAIPPVYAVETKILVSRTSQDETTEFGSLSEQELAQTFIELLKAKPVLEQASEQLNYEINPETILVQRLANSQVIQLTVEDTDVLRGMKTVNLILDVFISELNKILTGRYTAIQNSLELQITQVEEEMNELQGQIELLINSDIENQLTLINTQTVALEEEIQTLQAELDTIPEPQPTLLNPGVDTSRFIEAQNRMSQLESTLRMYKQMDVILSSSGPSVTLSLQQMILNLESQSSSMQNEIVLALQSEVLNLQNQIDALPLPLTEDRKAQLATTQAQLDELESIIASYHEMQVNLAILGRPNQINSEVINSRLQRLQSTMDLYEEEYINLAESLNTIQLTSSQNITNITQIEPATIPDQPVRPLPILYAALSGIIGLMLAAMIIGMVEALDDSVKSSIDIINIFGLPVLGSINDMQNVDESERWFHTQKKPFSPISEEFRVIQTKLRYTKRNDPLKTILVTSIGNGDGKTTVATNLAATYSKGDRNVILIDVNSRRPKLHEIFGIPNLEGFSDIIIHNNAIDSVTQNVNRFKVITHGLGDTEGYINTENISRLIRNLEKKYDFIVIDSPSMDIADTHVLASEVDGVLLVAKPGTSKKETALKARDQMHDGNVELLGVVFSRFKENLTVPKYISHQLRHSFRTIGGSIRRSLSSRLSRDRSVVPELSSETEMPETVSSEIESSEIESLETVSIETVSIDFSEIKYPDLLVAYEQNLGTTAGSRYQAVRLLKLGNNVSEIVEITGCNAIDLMAWESTYDEYGVEALVDENGSGIKLNQLQKDEIKTRLQAMTPGEVLGSDANQYNSEYWTLSDLTKAVKMWYGVEYQSRQNYYEIFRYSNLVYSGAERGYKLKESNQNYEEMDI